jgi:hypothetical protein
MPDSPPKATFENRYSAPPDFVAKWMTDYRPDDGRRWFDFNEEGKIERTSTGYHIEGEVPRMGRNVVDVTLGDAAHWSADGKMFNKKGRHILSNHIEESVEPEGSGTLHRVRIWMAPQTLGAKFMLLFGGRMMRKGLQTGFTRMKSAIEQEYSTAPRG